MRTGHVAVVAALLGSALSSAGTEQSPRVTIVGTVPALGGPKAPVTVDGERKATKIGALTAGIDLAPGSIEAFGIRSKKPWKTLRIKESERLWLVLREDRSVQKLFGDIEADRIGKAKKYGFKSRASGNEDAQLATLTIVNPLGLTGRQNALAVVDGKTRSIKRLGDIVSFEVLPGIYDVRVAGSDRPRTSVRLRPGELAFVIGGADAQAHRALATLMYDNNSHAAALSRYRRSLELDSTQRDLYARYAELSLKTGTRAEAIAAHRRLVTAGMADGAVYQTLGDLLLKSKNTAEAQAMFEKAMKVSGEDASVLAGLGDAKMRAGDINGAVFAFQRAIYLAPDSVTYYRRCGELLLRTGDSTQAMEMYRHFIARGGVSSDVAYTAGFYHGSHGRYEDAVRYLEKVQGQRTGQMDYLLLLGEAYFGIGQYEKASAPLRAAANKYTRHRQWPRAAELLIASYMNLNAYDKAEFWVKKYVQLGRKGSPEVAFYHAFLSERSSPATARQLYEKNVAAHPSDHRNHMRLGLLYAADPARKAPALVSLKKAVSLADTLPEAWLEVSRGYRLLGRHDDELAALRVFVASQPQHPEANARIGELALTKGKTEEAIARLETATMGGGDARMLTALARGYVRSGRVKEAVETLEQARRDAPSDVEIRTQLIDLYQSTGQEERALTELKGLLEVRRDNPTLMTYAQRAFAAGKYDEAVNAIEDIRATDPQNVGALMLLGKALRAQDKLDEAIEIYKEVSYIEPACVPALYERAEAHFENSQPHWAETFYRRALERDPKFARAELGLARVARLRGDSPGFRAHLAKAAKLDPRDALIAQERASAGL
jgi:tetratricopeptide (TPR) repeat protein